MAPAFCYASSSVCKDLRRTSSARRTRSACGTQAFHCRLMLHCALVRRAQPAIRNARFVRTMHGVQKTNTREVMIKNSYAGVVLATALFLISGSAMSGEDPKVAAEIMGLARAQWAAENSGKGVAEQSAATADDYTEFNQDYPTRIDGKALNDRLVEASGSDGSRAIVGDMTNPKVQVYGDTAILTYNFVGVAKDKEGKTSPSSAKSTRVYTKMNGKWMLVHANFAPVMSGQ